MHSLFLSFHLGFLKWFQTLKISLIKNLHYKFNFILMMILPVLVFFVIKYNLWISIYENHSYKQIQNYTLSKMIEYQFWILILDFFVRSLFFSQNISIKIRHGQISCFLLYPFSFLSYQMSLFLSDKLLQFAIGCLTLFLAYLFAWVEIPSVAILIKACAFVFIINIYWFFIQMFIGFLSFWLEETWGLNLSIRFISTFLSGSILPLNFYPEWLVKILSWTPFPYLVYIPVKVLMGEVIDTAIPFLILCFWSLILFLCSLWIWHKGLKLYSGSGM